MAGERRPLVVAVAGAAGLLGGEVLRLLQELSFPVAELRPIRETEVEVADPEAEQKESVEWQEEEIPLRDSNAESFQGADLAFLAGNVEDAGFAAKLAISRVPLTVDLSGRFADNPDVPLVLSDVGVTGPLPPRALVAVPDAATSIVTLALTPIHRAFGVSRVTVSTYEAASGRGRQGMDELGRQVRALFNYQSVEAKIFPRSLAFNAVPQVGALEPDGHSIAERAMARGLIRLLGAKSAPEIFATRVWVPVFSGHSASLEIDCQKSFSRDEARKVLVEGGIDVRDDPEEGEYPVNGELVGGDEIAVGRLRTPGEGAGKHLSMWVAADNIRRGSALAAIHVAQTVLARSAG